MEKIKLITDSTSDLSEELIKELDLDIIPLFVSFEDDDKMYKDGEEIKGRDILEHVQKTGKLPTTSCISPGTFQEVFTKYTSEGTHVIFTGIGSKLSGTYQSALLAQKEIEHPELVTIIDSNSLSSAIGLVLLKIRDFLKEGLTPEEVKTKVETEIVPNVRTSFCMNNVDYMVKGGRCSALKGFFAKMLSLKPVITVKDGTLILARTPIGTLNNAIKTIYADLMKELKECDKKYIMVTHFLSDECCKYITPIVEETCNFKKVYVTEAGCVIGSHCGPGSIGLLYIVKPKKN